ncbi:MAG: hypothetical protein KIT60_14550 [Burkholderiaceae bacterium]|nr:hypothetical protein [Burkholderiaceae bacterium]
MRRGLRDRTMDARERSKRLAALRGREQRELAASEQLPEIPIEADKVFAQVGHSSRQPGVGQMHDMCGGPKA